MLTFDLILFCTKHTNINLFFFDNIKSSKTESRDSIMYVGIKNQKLEYPNSKIITLTGGIHNMRKPYEGKVTMGVHCLKDTVNFTPEKICSIMHAFSEGSMLNNMGNGLELTTIPFKENLYSKSIKHKKYLVFYDFGNESSYNGLFYTERVNHSESIKVDKN